MSDDLPKNRDARALYVDALHVLLAGGVAQVAHDRDWDLLREVARMAQDGPPAALAQTDPALHAAWTRAVEAYRERGWANMTPARVDAVIAQRKLRLAERVAAHLPPPGTMMVRPENIPDSVIERIRELADSHPGETDACSTPAERCSVTPKSTRSSTFGPGAPKVRDR